LCDLFEQRTFIVDGLEAGDEFIDFIVSVEMFLLFLFGQELLEVQKQSLAGADLSLAGLLGVGTFQLGDPAFEPDQLALDGVVPEGLGGLVEDGLLVEKEVVLLEGGVRAGLPGLAALEFHRYKGLAGGLVKKWSRWGLNPRPLRY
jgi:hypothetical protein